ncbi:hypothetical protein [Companilactobacillus sp.]|uniref:hypothetical protein n=1 Tax=Companilactobacillus sp. TaxID=2767905 RepID=UPI00261CBA71|nr:hypothetical protein [Companilactobacillus sp.]
MDVITDAYYARYQWEMFKDRIAHHENLYSYIMHDYWIVVRQKHEAEDRLSEYKKAHNHGNGYESSNE